MPTSWQMRKNQQAGRWKQKLRNANKLADVLDDEVEIRQGDATYWLAAVAQLQPGSSSHTESAAYIVRSPA